MKKFVSINVLFLALIILFLRCSKENEDKDTEKPVIDIAGSSAFPKPCDTIYRGQDFVFKAIFTDNAELGSYNLELHHNFDHHTHGSHVETCPEDPVKEPVNPWYYNSNFDLPAGIKSYDAGISVFVPDEVDQGDYHFMVKLTDKEGWQSWQSVSVKIL
jgi:hypothetical protein